MAAARAQARGTEPGVQADSSVTLLIIDPVRRLSCCYSSLSLGVVGRHWFPSYVLDAS
jgi:hypothetical protein